MERPGTAPQDRFYFASSCYFYSNSLIIGLIPLACVNDNNPSALSSSAPRYASALCLLSNCRPLYSLAAPLFFSFQSEITFSLGRHRTPPAWPAEPSQRQKKKTTCCCSERCLIACLFDFNLKVFQFQIKLRRSPRESERLLPSVREKKEKKIERHFSPLPCKKKIPNSMTVFIYKQKNCG